MSRGGACTAHGVPPSGEHGTVWLLHFPSTREAAVFGSSRLEAQRGPDQRRVRAAGCSGHGVGAAGRPAAAASRALCRLCTERRRAAACSPQRTRWLRGYVPHLEFDAEWLVSATHLKRQRMMLPVARETRETL